MGKNTLRTNFGGEDCEWKSHYCLCQQCDLVLLVVVVLNFGGLAFDIQLLRAIDGFRITYSHLDVRVIKSRRIRWAGHVARMGAEWGAYRVLLGKPEGRRPLGRPSRIWMDNIRVDLQEVGCGYMDWIGLAQDRDRWRTLVSAVMNLRDP